MPEHSILIKIKTEIANILVLSPFVVMNKYEIYISAKENR